MNIKQCLLNIPDECKYGITKNGNNKTEPQNTKITINRNNPAITKEPLNENSKYNEINCIAQDKPNKKIIEPIIGRAIFNDTIENYLCDEGADLTIVNE